MTDGHADDGVASAAGRTPTGMPVAEAGKPATRPPMIVPAAWTDSTAAAETGADGVPTAADGRDAAIGDANVDERPAFNKQGGCGGRDGNATCHAASTDRMQARHARIRLYNIM